LHYLLAAGGPGPAGRARAGLRTAAACWAVLSHASAWVLPPASIRFSPFVPEMIHTSACPGPTAVRRRTSRLCAGGRGTHRRWGNAAWP
jgi:hypothetical protein